MTKKIGRREIIKTIGKVNYIRMKKAVKKYNSDKDHNIKIYIDSVTSIQVAGSIINASILWPLIDYDESSKPGEKVKHVQIKIDKYTDIYINLGKVTICYDRIWHSADNRLAEEKQRISKYGELTYRDDPYSFMKRKNWVTDGKGLNA